MNSYTTQQKDRINAEITKLAGDETETYDNRILALGDISQHIVNVTPPEPPPTGPPALPDPVIIVSCPIAQQNDISTYGLDADAASGGMDALFQAFELTEGAKIRSVKVSLKAIGAPTGSVVCGIYNNLTGEFPAVVPISPWLRQSGYLAMRDISPDGGIYELEFLLKPSLGPGRYAVTVERAGNFTPAGSSVRVGFATGGTAHAGNGGFHQNGVWQADNLADMVFELWGNPL